MDGSPSAITTMGFSTGSFSGSIGLIVTGGFGIGAAVVLVPKYPGAGTLTYAGLTGTFTYAGPTGTFERKQ